LNLKDLILSDVKHVLKTLKKTRALKKQ